MINAQAQNRADTRNCERDHVSHSHESRANPAEIASRNGIFSTDPVIEGVETLDEWVSHRETVVRELCPVGKLESAYAERAALFLWRLDRVIRYEITATEFDLNGVFAEFIVALNHPELSRDRSEAVTIEKVRKPLRDYLNAFQHAGAEAAKFPELQEGLERVRSEAKRIKERRIVPDPSTIQTIIKYEGHLQRSLTSTMAELRRLQKERRRGLREIGEVFTDQHADDSGSKPVPADFTEKSGETTAEANRAVDLERPTTRSAPPPSVQDTPLSEDLNASSNLPVSRLNEDDRTSDARRFTSEDVSHNTHQNMKPAHPFAAANPPPKEPPMIANPNRSPLERIPNSHYSVAPNVVARHDPKTLETLLHQKE